MANSLNLYEHQSSYCPNMPLRGLLYFCRQYEGLLSERKDDLYGSKLIRIPTPAYVIFYNGTKEQENRVEREILADILVKSRAEVMSMLLTEYDEKRHMKSIYEEGYEEGEQAGRDRLLEEQRS